VYGQASFVREAMAASSNLVANPSFISSDPANPSAPQSWSQGNWGANTAAFTYPEAGATDGAAAKVQITAYTSGDAKWVHASVPVTAGRTYTYTDSYKSDAQTTLIVEMATASGVMSYVNYVAVPASVSAWATSTDTFVIPSGVVSIRVFHLLPGVGSLTIDDVSITDTPPPAPADPSNLIANSSFAVAVAGNPAMPQSWSQGNWGANTAAFTYPVAGASDSAAAKVQITSYASGDAKWVHASVPVTAGRTYTYTDSYKSDAQTTLTVEMATASGVMSYVNYVAVPASVSAWSTSTDTFFIPSGVVSIRVFHLLPSVGSLTIDDVILKDTTATTTPPGSSAGVSVVAKVINDNGGTNTASDFNMAVSGASATPAFFAGNGAGTAVMVAASSTYRVTTTSGFFYTVAYSPDCTGALSAGDSVICTVTLDDIQTPAPGQPSPNLIKNPSLETPDPVNPNQPQDWSSSAWGTNAPTFTYTSTTTTTANSELTAGGRIVTVRLNAYTSGDAKWIFKTVPVAAGHTYAYQDAYMSDVPTQLVVVYTHADNTITYAGFVAVPASAAVWKQSSGMFVVPASVVSATVYHLIATNGTLSIDNTSLIEVPPPTPFAQGFVTLTFDDGLLTQYAAGLPILNAANVKASFYIITHTAGMAVVNPDFEIADPANATMPQAWLKSGSMNAAFSYPVAGQSGNAAEVSSALSGSNAAWHFKPVTVLADEDYVYGDFYKSTAASDILVQMTTASGTIEYIDQTGTAVPNKVPAVTLASSGGAWAALPQLTFYVPPEVKTVTILHRLRGAGALAIDTVSFGAFTDFMSPADLIAMQTGGHEIGGHTQTHPDLVTLGSGAQTNEIVGGRQDLQSAGISPALTFAYPYGSYNTGVQQLTEQAGYIGARSVLSGFNGKNTPKYALLAQSVNADTPLSQVQTWIDQARANKQWLILVFHTISNNLSQDPYGTTPAVLQGIVNYINANAMPVNTMAQGVNLMNP